MISRSLTEILKTPLIFLVFWVLLSGFSQMNIGINAIDSNANCPFVGHSMSICKIDPMEHIQEWQNMFTALPTKDGLLILSGLVALFALRKLIPWGKLLPSQLSYKYLRLPVLDNFQVIHHLQEAFAKGILNPKLF